MSIENLEKEIEKKKIELLRLKGKYGVCKDCGKEGYLSSGRCWHCDYKNRRIESRKPYEYLIGAKIADVEVEAAYYSQPDLYAILLDNGRRISVKPWSDPPSLGIERYHPENSESVK